MSEKKRSVTKITEISFFDDGSSEVKNYNVDPISEEKKFLSSIGFDNVPKRLSFFKNKVDKANV